MNTKNWNILGDVKGKSQINDVIKALLQNRGLKTKKEIEEFLNPQLEKVTIKSVGIDSTQLAKAITRIKKAIKKKERIIVFGDYDVDGICGSAILWETLTLMGANAMPYIPHRIDEGYGLSEKGIDNVLLLYPDTKAIITVDNGIVANQAVEYANKKGLEVIVTDHHVPSKKLPKAFAIVHTTQLCGTAVAYLLAQEIKKSKFKKKQDDHLGLVALATVADLVPLKEANRTLLKFGLEQLRTTNRPGIVELCKEAAIDPKNIGTYEIGHIIAPRLNATGRLESAMDSLRLICTKDPKRAKELAMLLGSTNRERQLLTQESVVHAITAIKNKQKVISKKLLFISHETYQPGVIGLIAGRLVEEYYLPSIVVSLGDPYSKASARSISGFNIIEFIRSASDLLVDVGGHPMAAGFTVETSNLLGLQEKLENLAMEMVTDELMKRTLKVECEIPLEIISQKLFDEIKRLEPFGMANPQPVFATRQLVISDIRLVGKENKHLKLKLKKDGVNLIMDGIGFGLGQRSPELKIGNKVDIAYSIDQDEWNGNKRVQLKIKDIKRQSSTNLPKA